MAQNDLKGLGPKSMQCLNEIGIFTKSDLEQMGPIKVFVTLKNECKIMKPSLNFLYSMVGAIEGVHWKEIAKTEKTRLLIELEAYEEMQAMLVAQEKLRSK